MNLTIYSGDFERRTDVISGMLFSNLIRWIATTASTLFPNGITNIDGAPKVAEALGPIAGNFCYLLFASGILGTGLLAVPILAGSAAYAIAETFQLREGVYLKLRHTHIKGSLSSLRQRYPHPAYG